MRDMLITVNGFIHDMATGVWVAVLLAMRIIFARAEAVMTVPEGSGFVGGIMSGLWTAAMVSMAVVMITGVIRGITFRFYGWTGDIARDRKCLLAFKHIILGIIIIYGLYLQFTMFSDIRQMI